MSNPLFAIEVAVSNTAKVTRGVNYFAWEFAVESHFGEGGVDDWAVDESEISWG